MIQEAFKEAVEDLLKHLKRDNEKGDARDRRIEALTPEEAQEYFLASINGMNPEKVFKPEYFGHYPHSRERGISFPHKALRHIINPRATVDRDKFKKALKSADQRVRILAPQAILEKMYSQSEINRIIKSWSHPQDQKDPKKGARPSMTEEEAKAFLDEQIQYAFSSEFFGIPEDPAEKMTFFQRKTSFFLLNNSLIKALKFGAEKMLAISEPGDIFVIFGNSPYFLGETLRLLCEHYHEDRTIINFPFSGSPNSRRGGPDDLNDIKSHNYVTSSRLEHLRGRLKEAGLSSENEEIIRKTIYFPDIIGSGSGIAYTIKCMIADFHQAEKTLPNMAIIAINPFEILSDPKKDTIAMENPHADGTTRVFFPSWKEPEFSVKAFGIPIEGIRVLYNYPHIVGGALSQF